MKKISKKTKIGILSVMSVFVLALCLFGITQFDGQESPSNNDEILFDSAINQASDSQSNNADNSSPVATLDNNESSFVVKEAQNENNNYQETSAEVSNNADFNITDEQKANVPVRSAKLVDDGFIPVVQNDNSFKLRNSSNDNDLSYKLVNDEETGFKQLVIGDLNLTDGTQFDSSGAAPWVNAEQKYITSVKIDSESNIAPRCTAGWFGCVSSLSAGTVDLSNIKKIEGLDKLDMSEVTDATCMFCGSDWIESIDASDTFFANITSIENATAMCNHTSLSNEFMNNLAKKIAPTATNTSYAFAQNFNNLTSFDLDATDFLKISNSSYMFYKDTELITITANSLIAASDVKIQGMFGECSALTTITLAAGTDWVNQVAVGTETDKLFSGCNSLVGGNGTAHATKQVDNVTCACIDGLSGKPGYFTAVLTPWTIKFNNQEAETAYNLSAHTKEFEPAMVVEEGSPNITYTIDDSASWEIKEMFSIADPTTSTISIVANAPKGTYVIPIKATASSDPTHAQASKTINFTLNIREHPVNYAVCIWNIEGEDGSGPQTITFGPATEEKYYSTISDSWEEIQANAQAGKAHEKYDNALSQGHAKIITVYLNDELYSGTDPTTTTGMFLKTIKPDYLKWNKDSTGSSSENPYSQYSKSRIRATLNGYDPQNPDTWKPSIYAGNDCLTYNNCLFSCFPAELKNKIKAREFNSATAWNTAPDYTITDYEVISDKLWLPSAAEFLGEKSGVSRYDFGQKFPKFKSTSTDEVRERVIYHEWYDEVPNFYWLRNPTRTNFYWLRNPTRTNFNTVTYIAYNGFMADNLLGAQPGIAPCFCL